MKSDQQHDSPPRLWYFAYGSNLHRDIFIERRQMRPHSIQTGWLRDFSLRFNIPVGPGERAVANIATESGARVWGVLYLLSSDDCERLDNSEGVAGGLYYRVAVAVRTETGERIGAFTYQSSINVDGRKPSRRYMQLLIDGARQHGLPAEYSQYLESFALAVDERENPPPPADSKT